MKTLSQTVTCRLYFRVYGPDDKPTLCTGLPVRSRRTRALLFWPGHIGARIEDVVLVRPQGGEVLDEASSALHVVA